MSKGFKETEIGRIPSDWKVSDLSEICDLKKKTCIPSEAHTDIYVGLEHIGTGEFILKRHGNPDEVRSAKNCFIENDILYGKLRPYLDKAVITNCTGICSTDILVFTPKNQTPSLYIVATIHTKQFLTHAIKTTHGVNHPRTSWVAIKAFRFPLPPLPEQKKIAAVLSKFQRAIEIQDNILGSLRDLKKSMMHRLFSYGLKGEKRKETEIGLIPEGWKVNGFGLKSTIIMGQSPSGELCNHDGIGTPLLNGPTEFGRKQPTPVQYTSAVTKLALKGDILFCVRGNTVGRLNIADQDYCIGRGLAAIRGNLDESDTNYVFYLCQQYKDLLYSHAVAGGSTFPNISKADLQNFLMPFPPLIEQTEIAHILQTIDCKIEIHYGKKSSYQDLFKTMLNKLMTGTIRVNELDIDTAEVEAA